LGPPPRPWSFRITRETLASIYGAVGGEAFPSSLKNPKGPKPSPDIIAVQFTQIFAKIYRSTYQYRLRDVSIARSCNNKRDKYKMANLKPI
jgi:hypothetical protein